MKINTRKHKANTQYIYMKQKMTSALKWSQINKINVLACAWSECFAIASWYVLS